MLSRNWGFRYAVLIDGEYLHPLEGILDRNAAAGIDVTVLDLHRWNKSAATEFYAKVPSATGWYTAFLDRLASEIAPLVAGRSGVWLSLWNEPFDWDAATDPALWLAEMTALVTAARAAGIDNVLVIPCGRMGQDEAVLYNDFDGNFGQGFARF